MKKNFLDKVKHYFAMAEVACDTPKAKKVVMCHLQGNCCAPMQSEAIYQEIAQGYTGFEKPEDLGIKGIAKIIRTGERIEDIEISDLMTINEIADMLYQKARAEAMAELKREVSKWAVNAKELFPDDSVSIH